jgi:lysophospholipase L1-like esterase
MDQSVNRQSFRCFAGLCFTAPFLAAFAAPVAFPALAQDSRPAVYLVGDSTVRNGTRGQMGWGQVIHSRFDTNRIAVVNRALGGRSSRTFLTEGLWDKVLADLKPGDFVLMQFGHNDNGPMDEGRARASIKGNGDETRAITNKTTGAVEQVRSYGAYLRHYIRSAKSKGATPIVLSLVPRNIWKDGRVVRATNDFGLWAAQAARQEGVDFIYLNSLVADKYQKLGEEQTAALFEGDHTHTNEKGAQLNADCVVEGIRGLGAGKLAGFLRTEGGAGESAPGVRRFLFGERKPLPGWTVVPADAVYDAARGFGFESGAQVRTLTNLTSDSSWTYSVVSDKPFLFSVRLPEGNYTVTVIFGAGSTGSTNTMKAESRRLMVEQTVTLPRQFIQEKFTVNIRTPLIAGDRSVRLKEREKAVLHWDDKLTLEFNGARLAVCNVVIEAAPAARTVYLLGDSTVTDQPSEPWNSWGQMVTAFFTSGAAIANHAESGESLKSSLSARRVEKVLASAKPGDYVLIQFGHNDQKDKATNALEVFALNLKDVIGKLKQQRVNVVLVTSMERMAGVKSNTLAGYPDRIREVAAETSVPLIDLNRMSRELYVALGADLPKAFQDGTHHNALGSYLLARCVVEGMRQNKLDICRFLRPEVGPFNPAQPGVLTRFAVPASPSFTRQKPDGN